MTREMTLNEAIENAEEKAKEIRNEAEHYGIAGVNIYGCEERAQEWEQFAEWLKELKQLREQTTWIPVSERLPGDSGTYFVTVHDGRKKRTTFAQYQKKLKNWVMTGARAYWRVKAWMPLPSCYDPQESEEI